MSASTPSAESAPATQVWPGSLPALSVPDFLLQESAQRTFKDYLSQALVLHIRGSSRAPALLKDGALLDLGAFGEGYEAIFQKSPRALAAAAEYRRMRIGGMTAIALSGAIAIVTVILTLTRTWDWPWLFAGAGGVVTAGTIGGFLFAFSPAAMSRAVAYYNEDTVAGPRVPWSEDDEP